MKLADGISIVMDDDTLTLLLVSGVDVYAEYDVKSKTWIENWWLMKPDFFWRPVSETRVLEITDGNLPSEKLLNKIRKPGDF